MTDREANRFSARAARYARVGANVGGVAARIAGARFFGLGLDRGKNALELAAALGGLKGPIMKVAQLLATIPDALPPEYASELAKLQSQAPPTRPTNSEFLTFGWKAADRTDSGWSNVFTRAVFRSRLSFSLVKS